MVAAKPTGASALEVTPAPVALLSNSDNSTEPVNKNDAFDEIKNKFLNEIDKIPRECLAKSKPFLINQPLLMQLWAMNSELDFVFCCRHWQPHNVFIQYRSLAALPNGREI